jgi:hypothetical protein
MSGIGRPVRVAAEDYESLKAFFAEVSNMIAPRLGSLPAQDHPLAALERFESGSMGRAREGLGLAIGDIIEMAEALSAGRVAQIDAALAAEGLLTLSAGGARDHEAREGAERARILCAAQRRRSHGRARAGRSLGAAGGL